MPSAADVKILALDPVGRFDALPDALIDRIIVSVSRSYYADFGGDEAERADVISWHVAHVLALAGVGLGGQGGGVGPVSSHSVNRGGASVTYAVAAVPVGVAIHALDGRTPYGVMALGIRDGVPTVDRGLS